MIPTSRPMAIDRPWLESALAGLVAIDSRNPELVPGAPGEAEAAAWAARAMDDLGLETELREPAPGRVSAVGRWPGTGGGPSLMWNAHLDTVGVEGMQAPFEPRVEGGRLYGRGAYDMKGSAAAMLAALRALVQAGLRPAGDLVLAFVADEETASRGTADVLTKWRTDGAIVTEPTGLELCLAHKGFAWIEVETVGRAAHGSRFDLGIDANLRMGRVLHAMEALEADLRARPPHPLVGPPSLHAATVHGGSGFSTYAERCALVVERRTMPGEDEDAALAEIEAILARLKRDDPAFEATARTLLARPPFEARADSRTAAAARHAGQAVLGRVPPDVGQTPWMDAALCAAAGIDTVVIGPVGEGAHAAVEWVDLESCARLAEILARAALEFCGMPVDPSGVAV